MQWYVSTVKIKQNVFNIKIVVCNQIVVHFGCQNSKIKMGMYIYVYQYIKTKSSFFGDIQVVKTRMMLGADCSGTHYRGMLDTVHRIHGI